ncbi:hypothetical protein MOUN0_J01310 [Monosporozyma unispora]|nr:hypothetical protein C6P44_005095 [Kazachstania unispora]
MQGGIRRKKDLLPRYKKNGSINNRRGGSILTTPMKKILVYLGLLFVVFLFLRVGYSDLNKIPQYELDRSSSKSNNNDDNDNDEVFDEILNDIKQNANSNDKKIIGKDSDNNKVNNKDNNNNVDADGRKKIPKDKFNNEVAMQQETKNLENDLKPQVDAKDVPNKGAGIAAGVPAAAAAVDENAAAKIAQKNLV